MATTPTNNPVPSESPRDLKFNAGKIDQFVTSVSEVWYTDRFGRKHKTQYGIEKESTERFNNQLNNQKREFEQFLLNSGYQFIGDYQNGPLTFTSRNQYTRYDGQYYRLNASTDVGFTTTGVSAASFANDRTHFVLMDGDTLRQNLSSSDGYKYIGQCPDIATLRAIEPTAIGQKIKVMSYRAGWAAEAGVPVGGGDFYYDKNDTTSADDDIFVFVTPGGARWKRGNSGKKINLEWKGIRSGDDATSALNSIGLYLKARAKAAGTIAKLPRVEVEAGTYIVNNTVVLTSAFRIKSKGFVTFKTSDSWDMTITKPIFSIENDSDIPIQPSDKVWAAMDPWLNGIDGTIEIVGPTVSTLNKCRGLSVGNTLSGVTAVRGACAVGFSIRNCGDGLHLRMKTTYLLSFKNFNIADNVTNITIPTQIAEDSGERISFSYGVVGASSSQHIYCAMAPSLFFDHVSFDYTAGDVVLLENLAQYGILSFTNCHSEVVGGFFLRSTTGSRLKVFLTNFNYVPTQFGVKTAQNSQSSSRPMFYLENGGNIVINGLSVMEGYRPLTHENFLVAVGSSSALKNTKVSVNGLTCGDNTYTPCPVKSAVMNPSWDISDESIGSTITNRTTYTTSHLIPAQEPGSQGWSSGQTAVIVDLGDGTKALNINNSNSGNYAYLQSKYYAPITPGASYSLYFSVQKLSATGSLGWGIGYYWYDSDGLLIKTEQALNGTFTSVYNDTSLPGYSSDPVTNGSRKIATTFGYTTAPTGAVYCRPFIRVTDFLGNINIINYVMWEAK